ncbi:MAG: fibronectin type III domain-containing protein [Candidatus Gracilibacteria bacterium]
MAPVLDTIQKYRFLAVALLVAGILGAKSLIPATTELEFTGTLSQLTAGASGVVNLQGEANEDLNVVLIDIDQIKTTSTAKTDEDGVARIDLAKESLQKAGTYTVQISYKDKKDEAIENKFEVVSGTPSALNSRVTFSQNSLEENQTALMSVILADEFANPVKGHSLVVTPNKNSVNVYTSEFVTNNKGQMNFSVTGNGNGIVSFNIFDSTEGQSILGNPALALNGTGTEPYSNEQDVVLASSGAVASFVASGLETETLIGDTQTLTVKAVDSDGFTVTNYTGTVRFSSTDSEAMLPNDYTFLAEDQGEHSFSLSVKFVTPKMQTLTITDLDDTSITGEANTRVVQSKDSTDEFNSDFETVDFDRTGDFDLVSPASGSYSTNSIEIQGEAEYGYTAIIYLNEEETGRTEIAFDNSFSYTLQDLADGTYKLYVEIAELDATEEITSVKETSSVETITVDTSAPEIVSIESDPKTALTVGKEVTITVLSEKALEDISIIFEGESYQMEETKTSGKYQAKLLMPTAEGDYVLDVLMADTLGNEAEYRKELTLTVGAEIVAPDTVVMPIENVNPTTNKVTGLTSTGDAEKVILSWEAPGSTNAIAFYRVYYGPSKDALFAVSETFDSSTTWMITELTPGESYYFSVTAVDVEGLESAQSDVISGIALAKAPSQNTGTNTPPIYNSTKPTANITGHVNRTPETGPANTALLILSGLATLAYMAVRKRA